MEIICIFVCDVWTKSVGGISKNLFGKIYLPDDAATGHLQGTHFMVASCGQTLSLRATSFALADSSGWFGSRLKIGVYEYIL